MTSGTLKANGTGSGGQGGTIDVTAHDSASALVLNKLVSRGGTGGSVDVRSDGSITINQSVLVHASNSNPGIGGTVRILPRTAELAVDCSDQLKIEQNIEADGYGSGGQGGTIQLEAPTIRMRGSGYLKHIRANGRPDGTNGSGGAIKLRAAQRWCDAAGEEFTGIIAHRGNESGLSSEWHHIHALPAPPQGTGEIQASAYRKGGDYQPTPNPTPLAFFSCTCEAPDCQSCGP